MANTVRETTFLFYFYCATAKCKHLLTFSKKADNTFSTTGFSNWKNALERFTKHEEFNAHSEAVFKVDSTSATNVGATLDRSLKQLSSLQYLERQGLGIYMWS